MSKCQHKSKSPSDYCYCDECQRKRAAATVSLPIYDGGFVDATHQPIPPSSAFRDMADTLEMWANQIREHCDDPANGLPSPHRIDDWLSNYRDAWAAHNAPIGG